MFADTTGTVIYVGKSNNLKRRLSGYRKNSRRKRFAKMRRIVRAAATLTWEVCTSNADALLREDALIKELKPVWNFAGTFFSTYPALGIRSPADQELEICFAAAAKADQLEARSFRVFGTFRDRTLTSEAFSALKILFELLGHPEANLRKRYAQLPRGTSLVAFRRIESEWVDRLCAFLRGESADLLSELAAGLLDRPGARRRAGEVEDSLKTLKVFFRTEPAFLAEARSQGMIEGVFVPCEARDQLTIRMQTSA